MKNLIVLLGLFVAIFLMYSCAEDQELTEELSSPEIEFTKHEHRNCGHSAHMEKLLSDPGYKQAFDKRMAKHKAFVAQNVDSRSGCSSPKTVPVAIHYQGISNPNVACLTTLAEESIEALNDDFTASNSDISEWTNGASSSFPNVENGEACVQFVIANTNHPSGYGLANGDLAITINTTSGDQDNNWSGYLNIFVKNASGNLGYAPLGGSGNGDGVVIDKGAFGTGRNCGSAGSSAPYNLGRTLTHEVGHYLLLDHIWGGGCNQDDGIADTPEQNSDYGGCPNVGASSCGSTDLHMNYMDYTNDACMYMFTSGQTDVMDDYLSSSLNNITNNASTVINGGGNTGNPTCAKPATTSATNITITSAQLSWTADSQASSYQVKYRVVGASNWTTINANQSQLSLSGLMAETNYQFKVRSLCPSGWTAYSTLDQFTTLADTQEETECDKPGFTQIDFVNESEVRVTWEDFDEATRYQFRYRETGTSRWTRINTTKAEVEITDLKEATLYQYKIRTRCSSGWTTYSSIETFETDQSDGGGTTGGSLNEITLELILDDYGSETSWELIDENDNLIASGGPYQDGQDGQKITQTLDLEDGCFTLYVDDAYGDGICCDYGDGSFRLYDINEDVIGESDGNFGTYDYIDFCVEDNVASFQRNEKDQKSSTLKAKTQNSH